MSTQKLRDYINSDEWDDVEEDLRDALTAVTSADPDDTTRTRNALIRYQMMRDFIQVLIDRSEATQ